MIELFGYALLPEWPAFLAFALAGFALNLVPGADMAFVVASSAKHGQRGGILAALGIGAGALIHLAFAVAGLSAVLAASQSLFEIVRWIGVAYLLWIAVGLVRDRGGAEFTADLASGTRLMRKAALVNLLNPKVAMFFLAFLPQFVSPEARSPALQILCLGLWFNLVGTAVNVMVALLSVRAAERFKGNGLAGRIARWLGAGVMGAMAVKLALARREA